jgi:hypothetical protein
VEESAAHWSGPGVLTDDEAWWFGPWGDDSWD